jgi:hypothetical protein
LGRCSLPMKAGRWSSTCGRCRLRSGRIHPRACYELFTPIPASNLLKSLAKCIIPSRNA